jgi:Myb-like DNA-binding domain
MPYDHLELKRIVHQMNSSGIYNWRSIADKLPNRTSKQCRERWNHHLSPGIVKDAFSPEEDDKLKYLWKQYGAQWSKISRYLPGRTENSVRSRLHSIRHCLDTDDSTIMDGSNI